MDTAINGFHHVKLPVTDPVRSRDWYARVLGLRTHLEFVEEGELMGVAMRDPGDSIELALRRDPARAAVLAGFDPLALQLPTPAALDGWQRHFEDLGEPHGGIVTGRMGRVLVGLHDPDGIEVRLYLPAEASSRGAP
ncbi:VOC family protein [Dactylosporangium aurantiacum]|uniref:VOC family protein n=1 Tax=Dactylosporangium aurantiacum TaxID=35754 RepID=A0A9Q9ID61_9ACTN|nr:VOC family protein [Dactylosporangium aurantiacum]MDG6101931.1 VOC family protein [Dactylosporangium aurantiacum]UWZ52278.1 VOC family protein [Dactylosporangium aurantiacum]